MASTARTTASTRGSAPAADAAIAGLRLSTSGVPATDRGAWWQEVICRQYANVEITSRIAADFYSEAVIYPRRQMQLSRVKSAALSLARRPQEPVSAQQDDYFAVVLLSGDYRLDQAGREAVLRPGDIALYDATRPHRIDCPRSFRKLIFAVPRATLRDRLPAVDACTALRVPAASGIGAVASNFLRAAAAQADRLQADDFTALDETGLDLLTLALASVRPANYFLSRSPACSLQRAKRFIDGRLRTPDLDTAAIAQGVGVSPRYLRKLFAAEDMSPMRYVLQARLENCRRDIERRRTSGRSISEIAFFWGFNDLSHFSRRFKERFGVAPSAL